MIDFASLVQSSRDRECHRRRIGGHYERTRPRDKNQNQDRQLSDERYLAPVARGARVETICRARTRRRNYSDVARASVPAMISGEINYFAGVGPGVASASLSGLTFRAVWVSSDRVSYSLVANPKFKTLQDLKGKKIGVTGSLGATNHVSLVIALEKLGMSPKDFNILALPPTEMVRSLESGFLDAVSLNPPTLFLALKKGFSNILDIGSLVEMPGGGLTVLAKDIKGKPDEVKRVIRAMQSAKDTMRKSKDKSVELMMRLLKMDPESAAATYEVFLKTLSVDGVPTRAGMDNLVKSIQAQGRFVDKKPAFTDVADDRLAKEVAKELGYRVQ